MKIALGTVQFGLHYGAFNAVGQVGAEEAEAVLSVAKAAGIDTLDTARAYGDSESVLGTLGATDRFRIVTKIAALGQAANKSQAVTDNIAASLTALRTQRIDALLFHSADDLLADSGVQVWEAAERACADGEAAKLGVSVYNAEEALAIADRFPIKLVQLPVSIFDQRAVVSGALDRLKARGIEIHARSVFLQGFALSDPDKLPPVLEQYKSELKAFRTFADRQQLSPLATALGFVLAQSSIDRVVVGVQTADELTEILEAAEMKPDLTNPGQFASSHMQLLNPGHWIANGE